MNTSASEYRPPDSVLPVKIKERVKDKSPFSFFTKKTDTDADIMDTKVDLYPRLKTQNKPSFFNKSRSAKVYDDHEGTGGKRRRSRKNKTRRQKRKTRVRSHKK